MSPNIRIALRGLSLRLWRGWRIGRLLRDRLGLADREPLLDDATRKTRRIGGGNQSSRMPRRKGTLGEHAADRIGQLQQPHSATKY